MENEQNNNEFFLEDFPPLINYEHLDKNPSNKRVHFEEDTISISQKRTKEISTIRGKIINQMLYIEDFLNKIIASYFSKSLDDLFRFNNIILSKKEVTLSLKWKILGDLMEDYEYLRKIDNPSLLRREIQELINIRNDLAHGQLKFDINSKKPFIEYYRNGIKREEITQDYLGEFNKKFQNVYEKLFRVYQDIIISKYAEEK